MRDGPGQRCPGPLPLRGGGRFHRFGVVEGSESSARAVFCDVSRSPQCSAKINKVTKVTGGGPFMATK